MARKDDTADQIYSIDYVEPGEHLIPLSAETAGMFVDENGNTPFIDNDGNLIYDTETTMEPGVIEITTQPNVRKNSSGLSVKSIAELAAKIAAHQQINAVLLRVFWNTVENRIEYHLVAGLRRTLAISTLNADTENYPNGYAIKVVIRVMTQDEALRAAISENIDRENMTAPEIGELAMRALATCKGSQTKASELTGIDRTTIGQYKKVHEACTKIPQLKAAWDSGALGLEAAVKLVNEKSPEQIPGILAMAYDIEAAKAEVALQAVVTKATAAGEDPAKAVEAVKANAAQAIAASKNGAATKSPVANVIGGKVSTTSIADAIAGATPETVKVKSLTGKQIGAAFLAEFSEALYSRSAVSAIGLLVSAIEGSGEIGDALQLLGKLFDPKHRVAQAVIAAPPAGKPAAAPAPLGKPTGTPGVTLAKPAAPIPGANKLAGLVKR